MRHCPNTACPHRRAVRAPAEFLDHVTQCSDCGGALVDGVAVLPRPATPGARLWLALALSGLAPVALVALRHVAIPGMDPGALRALGIESLPAALSLGALGATPLLAGFLLVELAAALVPRWRKLRAGSVEGRRRLTRAAHIVAFAAACAQAWSVAVYLQTLHLGDELSGGFRLGVMAALVAATAALGALAAVITARGLGNGYSALLGAGLALDAFDSTRLDLLVTARAGGLPGTVVTVALAWALGACALTVFWMRVPERLPGARAWLRGAYRGASATSGPRGGADASPPAAGTLARAALAVPTSGIAPLALPTLFFTAVTTLRSLRVALPWEVVEAARDGRGRLGLDLVVLAVGVVGFSLLWHRPRRVAAVLVRAGVEPQDRAAVRTKTRRALRRAIARSAGFLGTLYAGEYLAREVLRGRFVPGAVALATLAAVATDLAAEWRFRAEHPDAVALPDEHRAYAVEPTCDALARAGIPALPRAARHHALLQFFGPHVPVQVLVPRAHLDAARGVAAAVRGR